MGYLFLKLLEFLLGILRFDSVLCGVRANYQIQLPFWKLNSPLLFFSFIKFVKTDFLEDEGHLQFVVIYYNVCLESASYCYWKTNWRLLSLLLGLLLQVRILQQLIRPWACWSDEAQVSATALYLAMETMILESITCSIFEQMVWFSHLKALIFVKLFSNNHKQFQNRVFGLKLETKGYVLHTHTHTQLGRNF